MARTAPFTQAPAVKVVQPGEGRAGGLAPGIGVAFKIDGADTGNALAVVEHPFAVGAFVPPHVHTLEDEVSIVLEGQIGFRSEDKEVVLASGGYIVKPRGEIHAMWNAGDSPARMIEIISPAGFEEFFRGFVDMTDQGPPDPQRRADLAERFQLPFPEVDWMADVIARYDLTPLPTP
jgi:quercetin dioxygenase-like cupin family protein